MYIYNPGDIASGVMADALLRAVKWQVHTAACGVLWRCSRSNVFLWERSESMLEMDRIDEQFMQGELQLNTYYILTSLLPLLLTSQQNHLILTLLLLYYLFFYRIETLTQQVSLEGTHLT